MKWIIALLCVVGTTICIAQKPETVHGFAKEQREESWYITQLKLWKAEVEKDKTNGNAWYNYYRAARALRNLSHGNEAKFNEYLELCKKITEDAYAANPNSFEGNYLKWADGGNTLELFPYLKKAYEIDPLDPRTYEDLATYYEIMHNKKEYENAVQLMYTANTMHAGMINWGYNMLSEVDKDAVILTAGDNDTYSA
jgi:tetratricopeptide (TPR) repeat protein